MLEEKKQLKKKKRHFTDCELKVMIDQTDRWKQVLSGGLRSAISDKM